MNVSKAGLAPGGLRTLKKGLKKGVPNRGSQGPSGALKWACFWEVSPCLARDFPNMGPPRRALRRAILGLYSEALLSRSGRLLEPAQPEARSNGPRPEPFWPGPAQKGVQKGLPGEPK